MCPPRVGVSARDAEPELMLEKLPEIGRESGE